MPPTCDRGGDHVDSGGGDDDDGGGGRDIHDGDDVGGSDDVDVDDKADLTLVFCRILQLHR